jgi:hypothetical protein
MVVAMVVVVVVVVGHRAAQSLPPKAPSLPQPSAYDDSTRYSRKSWNLCSRRFVSTE